MVWAPVGAHEVLQNFQLESLLAAISKARYGSHGGRREFGVLH